jgi:flagellar biogenesis protein FliO
MYSHVLISLLTVTSPTLPEAKKPSAPGRSVKTSTLAQGSKSTPTGASRAAEEVVAKAFAPASPTAPAQTPTPAPPAPSGQGLWWLPFLALLAVAATAFVLSKKKHAQAGMIRIIESANLGPRRALVVAQVQGQMLLLASSEAGISVLSNQLTAPPPSQTFETPEEGFFGQLKSAELSSPIRAAMGALFPAKANVPSFEKTLEEVSSVPQPQEDEDLRAKLAAGLKGRRS